MINGTLKKKKNEMMHNLEVAYLFSIHFFKYNIRMILEAVRKRLANYRVENFIFQYRQIVEV